MAATPEGKVKADVRKLFDGYPGVWFYMPVALGYGKRTVDFLGCFRGRFFAVETKAEGKLPTKLQVQTLAEIARAGGSTFVVTADKPEEMRALHDWLEATCRSSPST